MLAPSRVAGNPRGALLCPALLDIRTHFPDMDPEGVMRYIGYARDEFHQSQLALSPPVSILEEVSERLDFLRLGHGTLIDVDGYVVDILVHGPIAGEKLDNPVAVLYHSPRRSLHIRSDQPL